MPQKRSKRTETSASRTDRSKVLPPLILAAAEGDVAAIRKLVHGGARVNETFAPLLPDYYGADALTVAARHGHLEAVKVLLAAGSKVDRESGAGTALGLAISYGHTDVVKALLSHGARAIEYGPFNALEAGHLDALWAVADAGIDLRALRNRYGHGLLSRAVERGKEQAVRALVERGVGPTDGAALVNAALNGNVDLTRLLLDHGADPNQRGNGRVPASMACLSGNAAVLELLRERGADFSAVDDVGRTCVDWAREGSHSRRVLAWLKKLPRSGKVRSRPRPEKNG
jgi:ankyrin repeat protein